MGFRIIIKNIQTAFRLKIGLRTGNKKFLIISKHLQQPKGYDSQLSRVRTIYDGQNNFSDFVLPNNPNKSSFKEVLNITNCLLPIPAGINVILSFYNSTSYPFPKSKML